ncbi:hypothetical protein DN752_21025 [Echinicola strongylocentroti]|uniref:Uncharacterized protein n=1 Tax=Echinicola strongylocentroti TaxID=1795355 RepID=A0A2Z4IPE6_9BACT|nr:hypothetical protein [Echinicola strongylocentroti]AWW32426.1 hypothetical protein DN752_21025 [Echinicola strongylocentroti]
MSTWNDVKSYVSTQLKPGVLGNTDVQKILNSINAVINQLNAGSLDPQNDATWNPATSYPADTQPVIYRDTWLLSNVANNQGNEPINSSGVVHPTWRVVNASSGSGIKAWEAGVYPNSLEIVFYAGTLYYLNRGVVGASPFSSTDIDAEIAANQWTAMSGEGGAGGNYVINPGTFEQTDATNSSLTGVVYVLDGSTYNVDQSFSTQSTPSSGNSRWEMYVGKNDGTIDYLYGAEAADPSRPSQPSGTIAIREVLRLDSGEVREEIEVSDFIETKFRTAVTSNSTGKYALIWRGNISGVNNYGIQIDYIMPAQHDDASTGRIGTLNLNVTCQGGSPEAVKFENQDSNAQAGDFELLEFNDGTLGIYQKSTHWWGRVEALRVRNNTGLVLETDFYDNQPYAALPSSENSWSSAPSGSGGSEANNFTPTTGTTITFDQSRKYGFNGTPVTGNLTIGVTGAKEKNMAKVLHNDSTEPTITPPGGWI